jgi:chromosome segregation ATPase
MKIITSFIIFLLVATTVACGDTPSDSLNKNSEKYLSFYETVDGERIHWEANFYGDEITSVYKNGKRIPDDLVDDYKHKVYEELDEMRYGGDHFSFRMPVISGKDFDFDFEEFNKEMEELQKELPKLDEQFEMYEFDSEEFKKEMEELRKELKENKAKIFKYKFNDEEFKEQMKELEEELEKNQEELKNFKFHFDWEDEEDDET